MPHPKRCEGCRNLRTGPIIRCIETRTCKRGGRTNASEGSDFYVGTPISEEGKDCKGCLSSLEGGFCKEEILCSRANKDDPRAHDMFKTKPEPESKEEDKPMSNFEGMLNRALELVEKVFAKSYKIAIVFLVLYLIFPERMEKLISKVAGLIKNTEKKLAESASVPEKTS